MKWAELEKSVRKLLFSRNLKTPGVRLNALKKLSNLIKSKLPNIYDSPSTMLDYNKNTFKRNLEKVKKKKLNGSEISIVNNFYDILKTPTKIQNSLKSVEFFKPEELNLFNRMRRKKYNKNSKAHIRNRKDIYNTVFKKTNYWAELVTPKGFELKNDHWPFLNEYRHMIFKPYTWARIYRKTDKGKFIFFTLGVSADDMALVYKIDCQWNDSRKFLDNIQVEKFRDSIKNSPAKRQEITFNQLKNYNWDKLKSETENFISKYTELYDKIIKYVWEDKIITTNEKNKLILRVPPEAKKVRGKSKKKSSSEIDYNKRNKENKILGDFGEKIVKQNEIESLIAADRPDLSKKVKKVKDGKGYDIISFDKFGEEKFIEVKTTKGNKLKNFPISANEYRFLKKEKKKAYIYRVFNAKPKMKFAEYFIMDFKKLHELFIREDLSYIMKKN